MPLHGYKTVAVRHCKTDRKNGENIGDLANLTVQNAEVFAM